MVRAAASVSSNMSRMQQAAYTLGVGIVHDV
jgi:hypothetical protein